MTLHCTENLHSCGARTRAVNTAVCPADHLTFTESKESVIIVVRFGVNYVLGKIYTDIYRFGCLQTVLRGLPHIFRFQLIKTENFQEQSKSLVYTNKFISTRHNTRHIFYIGI